MKKLLLLLVSNACMLSLMNAQQVKAPAPFGPIPTKQQIAWHRMECNAFIHFTVNTFTGKEWGAGSEPESIFNPTALNAGQWAQTLKQAGFKGMIFTAKHHDGFCLWPTKTTEHNITKSPYQQGKGNVVKEVAAAAARAGIKFGVYLSPWDRNTATYGRPEYPAMYRQQMQELMTGFGPVFEFWMDGANGGDGYYGGANEIRKIDRKTYYEWPKAIALARQLQPDAVLFSDAGPDIRWCGNEQGNAGDPNYNTITTDTLYPGFPNSRLLLQHGDPAGKQCVPSEVDVSIRPGWFYHAAEDSLVKTPEQLFDIYLSSVGRGALLLLNIPPDTRGLFHEKDVQSLLGFKKLLGERLGKNMAAGAKATATSTRGNSAVFSAKMLTDDQWDTYWTTDDNVTTGSVEIQLAGAKNIQYVSLQEYIPLGQRVTAFTVEAWQGGQWKNIAAGTTIGYKRILKIPAITTGKIRVNITAASACPVLSSVAVF